MSAGFSALYERRYSGAFLPEPGREFQYAVPAIHSMLFLRHVIARKFGGEKDYMPSTSKVLTAFLICLFLCPAAFSQGTAQISGTVRDQSGAVLPGVEVNATQTATGAKRTAVSDEAGLYVLTNLPSA